MRQNQINRTLWHIIALSALSLNCTAQAVLSSQEWDEKFNSPGAKLVLKETGRSRSNGQTVVTYSIFASGLPLDGHYTVWTRLVGSDPQAVAEAVLNDEGKAVCLLADPANHIAEDPLNLKVFAGRGEPKQFALLSEDGKFRVFGQVVPFPIEASDGPCHLSAVMTGPNYFGVYIGITGFQPAEDLLIDNWSEREGGQSKGKATDQGTYNTAILPFVKGRLSGRVRFSIAGKSCKVGIELPWGQGSYELQ